MYFIAIAIIYIYNMALYKHIVLLNSFWMLCGIVSHKRNFKSGFNLGILSSKWSSFSER